MAKGKVICFNRMINIGIIQEEDTWKKIYFFVIGENPAYMIPKLDEEVYFTPVTQDKRGYKAINVKLASL